MPQNFTQARVRGLNTFNSDFSQNNPDFLQDCNNIVLNRDNMAEPRRGLKIYGNLMGTSPTTDVAKQLLSYKKRILRHYGPGDGTTLEFDDGTGVFSAFFGDYAEVETGLRIKGTEVNGNLYFTTNLGIKKISVVSANDLSTSSGFITDAGGVKALDLNGSVDYTQTGFFTQNSVIAYRIVWGIKDPNGNLILGFPSSRLVIYNPLINLLVRDFNNLLVSLDRAAAVNTGTLQDTDYLDTFKLLLTDNALTTFNALVGLCNKLDTDMGGTTYATIAGAQTAPDANPTSDQLVALQLFYDLIVDALINESIANITVVAQTAGDFQNSTQSATTNLVITVPASITSDAFFYQVYRTAVSESTGPSFLTDLDPGDEEGLVFESNTNAFERTAGFVTYHDIVPESFRGANLYTNPQSGEGILQANEVPPVAKDIALFKNSVFYANTRTKHRLSISLLGVSNFVSDVSTISIIQDSLVNTYTFVSPTNQETQITHVAGANYQTVGVSDFFDIFAGQDTSHYRVYFKTATSTVPPDGGGQLVEVTITGVETATQVAVKVYNALNIFNDFFMTLPVTAVLTVTNVVSGVTTNATETVADPGFLIATTVQGSGEDAAQKKVLLSNAPTPAQQVDETARSLVHVINQNSSEVIYGFYLSGPSDVPGSMQFEARTLGTEPFYVLADSTNTGDSFTPIISPTSLITAISVANPTVITSTGHNLVDGQQIVISNSDSTPTIDGVQTITFIDANTFSIPVNVTIAGTAGGFDPLSVAVTSDNEVAPNRIYFSKFQQPEAVPIVNFFDVGPKDKAIIRILPLRDSLFVLKEDAVYRISGDSSSSGFSQALFDSSTFISAADSAVVLNNQIFMFSNQGVALVTDTGVSIISRPIENLLLPLVQHTNFSTVTFGVTYESDRAYLLWTTTNSDDTAATQCFRYNTFTNAWTKWEISKTCGLVLSEKLYVGAADTNFIEIERKLFDRTDYADREFDKTLNTGSVNGTTIALGNTLNTSEFDVLFQEQYLTIYELNQLLIKLDNDNNVTFSNYFANFEGLPGQNLRDTLTDLAAQLDTDPGVADATFSAAIAAFTSSFPDTQDAYNVIATKLNASNASFQNYPLSDGTIKYEVIISSVNTLLNTIVVDFVVPFIAGPALVFQHIPTRIVFNPQFFGDSELFKQISETKFIFDRTNFTRAKISYSSDLSPAFEDYTFDKQGNGSFGNQVFGETNFGGNADKTPLRTLVPRNKQRCRFIVPKIEHFMAREKIITIGYSMYFSTSGPRPYQR